VLVGVGTKNRSKVEGVRRGYELFFNEVELIAVEAPSGVPPQPVGMDVIFKGALNRALTSLEMVSNAVHGVGVEAGVYEVNGRWFDVQVAAIVDRGGWVTYGLSPSFEIPEAFINKILSGEVPELEVIVDNYFKTRNIGECGGFIKLLTRGNVLREDLTYYAVVMALVPRVNEELYKLGRA